MSATPVPALRVRRQRHGHAVLAPLTSTGGRAHRCREHTQHRAFGGLRCRQAGSGHEHAHTVQVQQRRHERRRARHPSVITVPESGRRVVATLGDDFSFAVKGFRVSAHASRPVTGRPLDTRTHKLAAFLLFRCWRNVTGDAKVTDSKGPAPVGRRSEEVFRAGQVVLKKGAGGRYQFNLVATNGRVVASSDSYETKRAALVRHRVNP